MTSGRSDFDAPESAARSRGFRWASPVGAVLIAVIALLVVSRLANLGSQAFHHDESIHCLFSWKIVHEDGGAATYRYSPVYHGPFLYFWGALGQKLLPDTDFFARLPYALVGICMVLLFLAWRQVLGWGGVLALMALLVLSAPLDYFSRFARNDVYQVTWMAGQIVTVVLYLRTRRLRHLVFAALFLALSYCTKENSYGHHGGLCAFLVGWGVWRLAWGVKAGRFGERLREIMVDYMPLTRMLILIGCASFFTFFYVGVDCLVSPETALAKGVGNIASNFLSDKDKTGAEVFRNESGYFSQSGREDVRGSFYRVAFGFTLCLLIFAEGLSLWLRRERLRAHWTLHLLWAVVFYGLLAVLVTSLGAWAREAEADRFAAKLALQSAWRLALLGAIAFLPGVVAVFVGGDGEGKENAMGRSMALGVLALQVFLVVGIFVLLFSSLGTNAKGGVRDGLYEYVAYWLRHQTGEHRIWGVRWYYVPRLMLFEALPIVLLGALGLGFLSRKLRGSRPPGDAGKGSEERAGGALWRPVPGPLLVFGVYWAVYLVLLYAALNEKVTWLLTYQSFAVNLLAGLVATHFVATGRRAKGGAARRWVDLSLLGILVAFAVGQNVCSVYVRPDRGTNLLVYTGTTHQFAEEMRRIEKMRVEAGRQGRKLRIGVHGQAEWPCAWHFRSREGYERHLDVIWKTIDLDREVQIMDSTTENLRRVKGRRGYLWDVREVGQRGWWHWAGDTAGLPGGKDFWKNVKAFLSNAPNDQSERFRDGAYLGARRSDATRFAAQILSYVFLRRIWYPTAYHKVLVCYRKTGVVKPEEMPEQLKGADAEPRALRGEAFFSGQSGAGALSEPRGLAMTPEGNIALADSKNGRVVVISPDGKPVSSFGADVLNREYSGPCDVACAPDGSFYVVDTWHHAVHRFSADGKRTHTVDKARREGMETTLWGPRGVAVGKNGNVYVTDTGNKYVCVYGKDLKPLFSFGGAGADRGMLSEPVGIATDRFGRVWVADTGNGRVQLFDAKGRFQAEYQTLLPMDGERVGMEPHLAVLSDGRLAVTYSLLGQIWFIDPEYDSVQVTRIVAPRVEHPLGIDVDGQGSLYVSDRKGGMVARVTPPPLSRPAGKPTAAPER